MGTQQVEIREAREDELTTMLSDSGCWLVAR